MWEIHKSRFAILGELDERPRTCVWRQNETLAEKALKRIELQIIGRRALSNFRKRPLFPTYIMGG